MKWKMGSLPLKLFIILIVVICTGCGDKIDSDYSKGIIVNKNGMETSDSKFFILSLSEKEDIHSNTVDVNEKLIIKYIYNNPD